MLWPCSFNIKSAYLFRLVVRMKVLVELFEADRLENAVGVLWIVLFDGCLGELLLEIYHFLQHPSLHHFVHTCVASLVQHILRTLNPDHSYVISRIPT